MKIHSLAAAAAAAAAILSLTACDRSEPTAATAEPKPPAKSEPLGTASLGEGRAMTQEEVAQLLAMQRNTPSLPLRAPSTSAAPLAKTAASTCIVDFNQQAALAALPGHAASTFVTTPYNHTCYNNSNYYMMVTPYNLDHFHLDWESGAHCFAGGNNWGLANASGACVNNVSDAMYWWRTALNMNSNTGIAFNAVANGSYRNFNFVAVYVRSGTVRVAAHLPNGGGWRYYAPATAGRRWTLGSTITVDQVVFFDNNYNGVISIDNVEVQIL